jgi:hypothetical protein
MSDPIFYTVDGHIALRASEVEVLQKLPDAHDRGGFYMAYNAMTDSNEAALQITVTPHLIFDLMNMP